MDTTGTTLDKSRTGIASLGNAFIETHKTIWLIYLLSFVETPRKFIIAELSIRKLGSSSVLIINNIKLLVIVYY